MENWFSTMVPWPGKESPQQVILGQWDFSKIEVGSLPHTTQKNYLRKDQWSKHKLKLCNSYKKTQP